jgi:hypothetical protein
MYLLDTNIVSDVQRRLPKPTAWLASVDPASINLSVITLGEIERGIVKLRKVDPERETRLDLWLRELRRDKPTGSLQSLKMSHCRGVASRLAAREAAPTFSSPPPRSSTTSFWLRATSPISTIRGVTVLNPWTI